MPKKAPSAAFVFLLLSSCAHGEVPIQQSKPGSPPARPAEAQLEKALEQAAHNLLEIIRKGDERDLLALFSRAGAEIGADNRISYGAIRKDLEARGPIYCEFYDTSCLRKHLQKINFRPAQDMDGERPWPVSYREILNTVSGLEISARLEQASSNEVWGQVVIKWKSPQPRELGVDYLNFAFVLENGEWKLASDGAAY